MKKRGERVPPYILAAYIRNESPEFRCLGYTAVTYFIISFLFFTNSDTFISGDKRTFNRKKPHTCEYVFKQV